MTTVTEDGGRENIYAIEPEMQVMEITMNHNENAEKLNGRLAMLGVIAAILLRQRPADPRCHTSRASTTTGQLIPV